MNSINFSTSGHPSDPQPSHLTFSEHKQHARPHRVTPSSRRISPPHQIFLLDRVLQSFASFEHWSFRRSNLDRFLCPRVPAGAGPTGLDFKRAKPDQLNFILRLERILHNSSKCVQRSFTVRLGRPLASAIAVISSFLFIHILLLYKKPLV